MHFFQPLTHYMNLWRLLFSGLAPNLTLEKCNTSLVIGMSIPFFKLWLSAKVSLLFQFAIDCPPSMRQEIIYDCAWFVYHPFSPLTISLPYPVAPFFMSAIFLCSIGWGKENCYQKVVAWWHLPHLPNIVFSNHSLYMKLVLFVCFSKIPSFFPSLIFILHIGEKNLSAMVLLSKVNISQSHMSLHAFEWILVDDCNFVL